MKLYFTRHGKTQWNAERRFQGMMGDSPLLASSYQEIELLAKAIQTIPFEHIYSSSAMRAQTTARELEKGLSRSIPITYTDDLKELGLGLLEGQSIDEMSARYPQELSNLRHNLAAYQPTVFMGEPIEAALNRMQQVVIEAVAKHNGPLLFVGHGASMTAGIQWLLGKELAQLREMGGLFNNSLTILETTDSLTPPFTLKTWNDTSFLTDSANHDALL
ncbi:MAG: histidine phosphatase family protein [Enterococcus sp.]